MTSIAENRDFYDVYDWSDSGNEWAGEWVTSDMQWVGTIYPRIYRYLPASTIVEIGAGFGRWSHFLRQFCERLVLLDLSTRCVAACNETFRKADDVAVHLTDGCSIPGVSNGEAEFVFSFFSLVHSDIDTIGGYLQEIRRVLSPYGVAFLHHSNMGASAEAPGDSAPLLKHEFRDATVSASLVQEICDRLGLCCPVQEIFSWDGRPALTDCFTVIAWPESNLSGRQQKRVNADFALERRYLGEIENHYEGLIRKPPGTWRASAAGHRSRARTHR